MSTLSIPPKIWAIVNCTPDSFSDGGLFLDSDKAFDQVKQLLTDGADFIDIGAASSRPTSDFISAQEEWERLLPLFELIEKENQSLFQKISVDTWRADVAQKVLEKDVFCINDISAFEWEPQLLDVIAHYKPYYVLMHCQGKPQNMQKHTQYEDVVDTVYAFFENKLKKLQEVGFPSEKIILDPGIGFGKTLEQNYRLMKAGEKFKELGFPLMAGISRKSCLRDLLFIEKYSIDELDSVTALASVLLYNNGFEHHRVHNAKACHKAFLLNKTLMY